MSASSAMSKNLQENSRKLILIDGYGFVFRAYHATAKANMKRLDGTPVGAVYAFINMLIKTVNDHEADYIAVVFDAGKKTFRSEIYEHYKANRPPAPEDLIPQFPLVRKAAQALNLAIVEKEGFEADDLIATYTKIAKERGHDVVIVSSDKDLMQLVGQGVQMYDSLKAKIIDTEQVFEKFGVAPDKVLDVLSLMGDASDNIPGVPSIGPKTAAELINSFGSLEGVFANTAKITQEKRRQALEDNKDKALLSRELVKLRYDVPVDLDIEDFVGKYKNIDFLIEFLREQGFKSLVAKFEKLGLGSVAEVKSVNKDAQKNTSNHLIKDIKNLSQWFESKKEIQDIVFFVETDDKTANELGISFYVGEESCYFPLKTKFEPSQGSLFGDESANTTEDSGVDSVIKQLKPLLEDKSILKIGHNIKKFLQKAKELGVKITPFDDVMVMSYSIETGLHKHDLQNMIIRHCPQHAEVILDVKISSDLNVEKAMYCACTKTESILKLHEFLKARIFAEKKLTIYERIDKPLIEVVGQMESYGIKVDISVLKGLSDDFTKEAASLEKEIFNVAGLEFNIGSPKQLGEVLFDNLKLNSGKKSKKSGAYSTDVQVLQSLADDGHVIAEKILQWRHISKMKSTYTDALPKQVKKDGRVHTTFEIAATSTGRLSSRDPNLQNIPIRSEDGTKIRKAFIAESGCKLISADYSQIELRLLAHMADMPVLQDAFKNNIDIHSATASQIFKVDLKDVDSELRRKAKTINFGIIYGISAFGLSQRLGIPRGEAAQYIKQYFEQYPGIEAYMKKTVEFARQHGYVETIWGRKCFINGINDKNAGIRQFSERAAINAPLQGSAADIIKKAMVQLEESILKMNYKAKILLQVHDELVVEAPASEAEKVASLIKNIMQNAADISVPATVDIGIGDNWNEIH